ncbi:MAG: trehalose synthase [Flavobacteriales bacterium]|nr:trehalose synthase [Flavobacteriales bacterium]
MDISGLENFKVPYVFETAWEKAFEDSEFKNILASNVLEQYIVGKRWFGGKSSTLKYIDITDFTKMVSDNATYYGLMLEVNFKEAFFQNYFLPVAFVADYATADRVIAPMVLNGVEGYVIDALHEEDFRKLVFDNIVKSDGASNGQLIYHGSQSLAGTPYKSSRFMGVEQSNTSIIYNDNFVLKFFRRIYSGTNPDYEVNRFLSETMKFQHTPKYKGSINLSSNDDNVTLALMQEMVPNQGDAWDYMNKIMYDVFDNLDKKKVSIDALPEPELFKRIALKDVPQEIKDWVGEGFFERIKTLAVRTAQMHIALGGDIHDTAFTPERYNGDYTVWLKNRLTYQFQNRINLIENNLHKLNGLALDLANKFLDHKNQIRALFLKFDWHKMKSERIRIHGDYHLGQILVNQDDFIILDFEGEPENTIMDRKVKQPPLKDVAGLFRSFHYCIYATIFNNPEAFPFDQKQLFKVGEILNKYMIGVFLYDYINLVRANNLDIGYMPEIDFFLRYCMLEKAVYELGYELNSRPKWTVIPLEGIASIMEY